MDKKSALRDWLWYQSEHEIDPKKKEKKEEAKDFERLVSELFQKIDFSILERDRVLVEAYNFLSDTKLSEFYLDAYHRNLILALLDGGMAILNHVDQYRKSLLEVFQEDLKELEADRDPVDKRTIEEYSEEISTLTDREHDQIFEVLAYYNKDLTVHGHNVTIHNRPIQPCEAAFAVQHRKGRNGINAHHGRKVGKGRKEALAAMFGLNESEIPLDDNGNISRITPELEESLEFAKMMVELKNLYEERLARESAGEIVTSDSVPSPELVLQARLQAVYSFIDVRDHAFVASRQPTSFDLDHGKITPAQRHFIYSVILLTEEEKRSDARHALAALLEASEPQVNAVTAYLTGGCKKRSERARTLVEQQIRDVETYIERKKQGEPVYEFLSPFDRQFAMSIAPQSFVLDGRKFSYEQRRWVYAVVTLTPSEKRPEVRKRLAKLFGCRTHQIGAISAYLGGGCYETVSNPKIEQALNGIRSYLFSCLVSVVQGREGELKKFKEGHDSADKQLPVEVYEFLSLEDRAFAQTLCPTSFVLTNGEFDLKQREWVYALITLTPEEERPIVRKSLSQLFGCTPYVIGAVSAYLRDGCYARRKNPEILSAMKPVTDYMNKRIIGVLDHSVRVFNNLRVEELCEMLLSRGKQ